MHVIELLLLIFTGISKLQINTDSQFLIKCITQWLPKWQKNGWKISDGGDVKNKVQLIDLHQVMKANIEIKWVILLYILFGIFLRPYLFFHFF